MARNTREWDFYSVYTEEELDLMNRATETNYVPFTKRDLELLGGINPWSPNDDENPEAIERTVTRRLNNAGLTRDMLRTRGCDVYMPEDKRFGFIQYGIFYKDWQVGLLGTRGVEVVYYSPSDKRQVTKAIFLREYLENLGVPFSERIQRKMGKDFGTKIRHHLRRR